jgi:hypothetical protein
MIALVGSTMSCSLFNEAVDTLFDGGFKLAPEITSNDIYFEITGIGTGMRGYDNFPSITLFVSPKTSSTGELITGMQEADFFDVIDDNGEARPITVTPRGAVTSFNKQADIVFIIDTTGSMASYITTMTNKAQDFADTIAASDTDFRLGFVSFGDDIRKGAGERLAPTSDVEAFKTAVGALAAYGGADGPENQIDAIDYARAGETGSNPAGSFQQDMEFLYRDSALLIFILITDIDYHIPGEAYSDVLGYYPSGVANTVEQEILKLNNDGISCYVVAPTSYEDDYDELAEETGAAFFDISSDFSSVIDTIGEEITTRGDYMITFMTNDFTPNKEHRIRIAIHTSLGNAQDIAYYTSPAVVDLSRATEYYDEHIQSFLK